MSSLGWFPPRICLEDFKWTREKAEKVRVTTNSLVLQELAIPAEPNEAERELREIMKSLSIDCLLTPFEQYWACRYMGLLPPQPRDKIFGDKFQRLSDSADDLSRRPLRKLWISKDRSGLPVFLDKQDGCEMAKVDSYMTPFVRYGEASRSSASADQLVRIFEQWERDGSVLRKLRWFYNGNNFETWTDDEIATAFVAESILRPASVSDQTRRYLRAWGDILRAATTNMLIYTEARSGENVLMRGSTQPFSVGFRDTLWARVRRAESRDDPAYDAYHRDLAAAVDRREMDWIANSESFRPFYLGDQSSEKCRPGVPGETLVNERHLVEFSLMLVHLRLVELRNRVSDSLRACVLRQGDKWRDLCFPEQPMLFREWTTSLAPCLAKRFSRLFEELDALGEYKKQDSRLDWDLYEALKTAIQLYRANGWPVDHLIGIRPFSRLSAGRKLEYYRRTSSKDLDDEIKADRIWCHTIVKRGECPFKSTAPGECTEMCKKNIKVKDIEDLAVEFTGNTEFPLIDHWNPHIASLIIAHSKRICKE